MLPLPVDQNLYLKEQKFVCLFFGFFLFLSQSKSVTTGITKPIFMKRGCSLGEGNPTAVLDGRKGHRNKMKFLPSSL